MAAKIATVLFCFSISVLAQNTTSKQSNKTQGRKKDDITVRGCVTKLSTDYVLDQPDQANSYELQGTGKIRLRSYLGQEVEVTGEQSPWLSTSSDVLTRSGSPSPITITVQSIKSLAKRCSAY